MLSNFLENIFQNEQNNSTTTFVFYETITKV